MIQIPIRAIALLALLAQAACSAITPPEVIQDTTKVEVVKVDSTESVLARSRARWAAERPATYDYTIRVSCFCGSEITRPVVVVVQDTTVVSRTYVDNGAAVPAVYVSIFPTIDGVFDVIADAVAHKYAHVGVTYDPSLSYPTSIGLDVSTSLVDDERVLTLTNFHAR